MISGNMYGKKKLEFDFVNDPYFKVDKNGITELILRPHQGSSVLCERSESPAKIGSETEQAECTCISGSVSKLLDRLADPSTTRLVLIDPVGLPLVCLTSILSDWKTYSNTKDCKIALALLLRDNSKCISGTGDFSLWRDNNFVDPSNLKGTYPLWLPSIELPEKTLMKEGKRLAPYDVYPLVDFTDGKFFRKSGILKSVVFLESFRTRTRNFIYLDTDRPDFVFERLSSTITSLTTSNFSVLDPVVSPGGYSSSYIAEVCAAVLTGAMLFAEKDFNPYTGDMKLKGFIVLRYRS